MKKTITLYVDHEPHMHIKHKHGNVSQWVSKQMWTEMEQDAKPQLEPELSDFEKNKIKSEALYSDWYKKEFIEKRAAQRDAVRKSKQELYNNYLDQGMSREEAKKKAGLV